MNIDYKFKYTLRLLYFALFFINTANSYASRYICTHGQKEDYNFTNLYLNEDYLSMSGAIGKGQYKIIVHSRNSGFIAINTSIIGNVSGAEIVFLDFKSMFFSYSTTISGDKGKEKVYIIGKCK